MTALLEAPPLLGRTVPRLATQPLVEHPNASHRSIVRRARASVTNPEPMIGPWSTWGSRRFA